MGDRLRRAGVLAGCLAVLGAVAAGCSPSDDDGTLPDRTPPTTPATTETTASPTPTDPTAALEAEITAFFEDYIATVNASWTSEDALARRRTMFADSCEVCIRGYDFSALAHRDSLIFEGELGNVIDVVVVGVEGDEVSFLATIHSPAARLVGRSGTVVQLFDEYATLQTAYQAIKNDDGSWLLIAGTTL